MAITVQSTSTVAGDKAAAASKTINTPSLVSGGQFLQCIILFSWLGSTSGQTLSVTGTAGGGASAVLEATILAQRQSSGATGVAVILLRVAGGASVSGTTTSVTVQVSSGSINAWGANWLTTLGAGPETAVAWVGADNAGGTTTAPTATSGAAQVGDLVIGALSLKGPTGDSFTQDADTTGGAWTTVGGASGTTGGSATTNNTSRGGYKIVTAAGTQTYNPALGTARNYAELIGALRAVTVKSGTDVNGTTTEGSKVNLYAEDSRKMAVTGATLPSPISATEVTADGLDSWTVPAGETLSSALAAADGTLISITPTSFGGNRIQFSAGWSEGVTHVDSLTVSIWAQTDDFNAGYFTFSLIANDGTHIFDQKPFPLNTLNNTTQQLDYTLTQSELDSFNSHGVEGAIFLCDGWGSFNNIAIDYFNVSANGYRYDSMVTESASLGGGSTPKSSSDVNGTTTEINTPTYHPVSADSDGATTEVTTPHAQPVTADAGSAVTELISALIAQAVASDQNSGFADAASLKLSGVDGGAVSESANEIVGPTVADSNSATTDAATSAASIASADAGSATVEFGSISSAALAADVSVVGESAAISFTLLAADSSGVATENASPAAHPSSVDAGVISELAFFVFSQTALDTGTVSVENASFAFAQSATDTGAVGEVETFKFAQAVSDAGNEVENGVIAVSESATDAATDSETGQATISFQDADSASDSEVAQMVGQSTDLESGVISEDASSANITADADSGSLSLEDAHAGSFFTRADSTPSGTESGSTVTASVGAPDDGIVAESASQGATASSTDAASTVEFGFLVGATFVSADHSSATGEINKTKIVYTSLDQGTSVELANYRFIQVTADGGSVVELAISPTVSVSANDIVSSDEFQRIAASISDSDSAFGIDTFIIAYEHPGGTGEIFLGVGLRKPTILATTTETETATANGLPTPRVISAATPEQEEPVGTTLAKPGLKRVR